MAVRRISHPRTSRPGCQEKMTVVAIYPDSTKTSMKQRLRARVRERWPQIASLQIRHRGVWPPAARSRSPLPPGKP